MPSKEAVQQAIKMMQAEFDRMAPQIAQVLNDIEPGNLCVCGELAQQVVDEGEYCEKHAEQTRDAIAHDAWIRER